MKLYLDLPVLFPRTDFLGTNLASPGRPGLHLGGTTILKGWNQLAQGCEERATLGLPAPDAQYPERVLSKRAVRPGDRVSCTRPMQLLLMPLACFSSFALPSAR